ncbi:MerR family transcriptional regulator, partial [Rhizobium sp. SGZ-381]|uniref:MerR family transcriptional regulator n=1 Tax=Rhizobium sp. SGZ-381 TaxID=3342800 RepID=UPI003670EC80
MKTSLNPAEPPESSALKISRQSKLLSAQLQSIRERLYEPESAKTLKTFTSREVAQLLGIAESTLRQMSLDGEGVIPDRQDNGRRIYTLSQVNQIRAHLANKRPAEGLDF